MKKFSIRKMDAEDVRDVLCIAAASELNPWSERMFLEEMAHPCSGCFVIDLQQGDWTAFPAGFICFRHSGEESELFNIGVHPLHRRKGLGRHLLAFYIDFCGSKGVKKYFLEVSPRNLAAIRLYREFAFQEAGLRKNFYQGKYDAILMEKTVNGNHGILE